MTNSALTDQVRDLLTAAADVYRGTPAGGRFEQARTRLDEPLLVAVCGRVKAGKSTLLNALVGATVAPTDAGECTLVVTRYSWGPQLAATAHLASGPVEVPVHDTGTCLRPDLSGLDVAAVDRLDVRLPAPALQRVTLLDTPGTGSLSPVTGARSEHLLTGRSGDGSRACGADVPDAVIYLLRRLHGTDVDFLEAFRDPVGRSVPPVNAVGVLSHADEVGGGRPDALQIAARLAEEYATEPRMRSLLQTVVPVAGLLAEAAATVTPTEHTDLMALAEVSPAVTDPLLLSAARFASRHRDLSVTATARRQLLARLGLFGVRWALQVIRAETAETAESPVSLERLRADLLRISGAQTLISVLKAQITGRRDVLKADAALRLVRETATGQPVGRAPELAAEAERIRVAFPDFDELRLLNDLRVGIVPVDDADRVRMERLLGTRGGGLRERLGCPAGSDPATLLEGVQNEHAHWHRAGSDVLAAPALVRACAVLERVCAHLHARARA